MKHVLSFFLSAALFLSVAAQDIITHSRVKIQLNGQSAERLAQTGIDLTEGTFKAGKFLETDLSAEEISKVIAAGFQVETLIPDVAKFYRDRSEAASNTPITRNPADEFPVPQNWEYGSMGGMYTYQQVLDKLDFMAAQWPDLISVRQAIDPLNSSHLGNPIWWVKISDNPGEDENEPEVLYTSLIHAREGIGVQQMMYFMLHLLENYDTDTQIQTLVNNRELYFVPIVNPDGYLYNQQTSPSGGGMWRKNRRNNGGSYGVDINRNFGYKWGYDNNGSSPYANDETYRGPSAFSEPETQNLKKFVEEHQFAIALNYHSYSNLLLYPWGYTPEFCPDNDIFHAHASLMTRDSHYTFGPASTTIYEVNGCSDDYMYGDTENKPAIFAYTPEVGDDYDGFWPSTNRIIPLCQENMIQNMYAAWLAGSYGKITDLSDDIIAGHAFYFPFSLQRLGFASSEGWTVSIVPVDETVVAVGEPVVFGSLGMLEQATDSIAVTLSDELLSGDTFRFVLQLDNGEFVTTDTITKMFGNTITLLDNPCDLIAGWTNSGWGITTSSFVSAPASISDSPNGNYNSNVSSSITLTQPIELPETPYANLSFWTKWDIEAGWDYAQIKIKPSGAFQWTPLTGKYTKPGGSNQPEGEPLYDGTSAWVKEQIDLTPYAGTAFQLRFTFESDGSVVGDGFYFDDIKIVMLNVETAAPEIHTSDADWQLFPNPAKDHLTIKDQNGLSAGVQISVVDVAGRTLLTETLVNTQNVVEISLNGFKEGLYFVKRSDSAQPQRFIVQ